jgi:hypothetical protein
LTGNDPFGDLSSLLFAIARAKSSFFRTTNLRTLLLSSHLLRTSGSAKGTSFSLSAVKGFQGRGTSEASTRQSGDRANHSLLHGRTTFERRALSRNTREQAKGEANLLLTTKA